ncbi:TonB family protein [Bacteroides reticulotermitis]|uniref:TonB family protein n=2 Tax=Bacteroides reticulotermitis TaxID=1133319 RepID=A0A840CWK9_9BACE|nr:energy transducer TonB [Bacteroides reticulotermitis]MBB4043716.1 TonB family protein [Bacteroides reticulotermitis]
MKRGKQTCRILKEIRRQIAEANDIDFITSECQYQGDCLGTCPKCEAEVRYLEKQLLSRQRAGLSIKTVGVSLGLSAALGSSALYGQETAKDSLDKSPSQIEVAGKKSHARADSLTSVKSADTLILQKEDGLFGMVEASPTFPGGQKALFDYIKNNFEYPKNPPSLSGRIIIQILITKKGEITDAKIVRGIHPDYDKEALRVIANMPQWKPGTLNGKPVDVKYSIPVIFRAKQE